MEAQQQVTPQYLRSQADQHNAAAKALHEQARDMETANKSGISARLDIPGRPTDCLAAEAPAGTNPRELLYGQIDLAQINLLRKIGQLEKAREFVLNLSYRECEALIKAQSVFVGPVLFDGKFI